VLDVSWRKIDADHRRGLSKANQYAHATSGSTTQINTALARSDAGGFG
jgi:hypothetical protein